jgi:hypothetical protein
MRVPKVNSLNTKTIEALLASNRHVCGITTESEARRQQDGAELGGEEDILALLGVQGNPFADDDFRIALHAGCKSKLIVIVVLEILVYLLRRNRLYPKRCIQVRELDQGEQDAQDRGWEPWFGSRESPSP